MNIQHFRPKMRTVAERWKETYFRDGGGGWNNGAFGSSEEIYNKLAALDPATATPAQVAAILGNDSWILFRCEECSLMHPIVVSYGDSPTVELCLDCLRVGGEVAKALKQAGV